MIRGIVLTCMVLGAAISGADMDQHDQQALKDTQQLLKSPSQRREAIQKDPKAKAADGMVDQLSGGNQAAKDDIYKLASQVFEQLTKEANGDPAKMQEILAKFKADPAAFAETWTPEQKAQLKAIAEQVGAAQSPVKK